MNHTSREELTALIKSRIALLQTELQASHTTADKLQLQADDASANLDLTINASVDSRVLQEHRLELLQLTKSLAWLDSEEAGLCEECGSEISLARLKVVPNSRLCITCAQ